MIAAFASGLLFGGGLILSGMVDPANVLGFFDVAGEWNPTLAFVMAGGLGVTLLGYGLQRRRMGPPPATMIDARLLGGAALFGLGWGLAGYCPGPAVAATAGGILEALPFTLAMLAGMLAWNLAVRLTAKVPPPQ